MVDLLVECLLGDGDWVGCFVCESVCFVVLFLGGEG